MFCGKKYKNIAALSLYTYLPKYNVNDADLCIEVHSKIKKRLMAHEPQPPSISHIISLLDIIRQLFPS